MKEAQFFSALSRADCERIHGAALRLLERVGVSVADREAAKILKSAGARVDTDGTVYLSSEMIRDYLRLVPRVVEIAGSDGNRIRLPSGSPHYVSRVKYPRQQGYPPAATHVPSRQDIVDNCRLANALSSVEAVFVLDGPTADFADEENWLLTPATVMSTTPKHIISPSIHLQSARYWAEMAEAASAAGDLTLEPLLTIEVSPHGPLKLDADTAQVELFAVRKSIPLLVLPIPMAGVTSPITLAGTVAVGVAESLFMIVLAQAVRPGAPVLYGGNALTFSMRAGAVSLGDPEAALLGSAELAMSHFYGLPNYRVTGFTDSFFPDFQAGVEKTASALTSLLGGADLVTLGGALGTSTVISAEQIVLDHDVFEVAKRISQRIAVTDETLALDVIEAIGHRGGEYLSHPHTIGWLRSAERYFGGLFNRRPELDEGETMLAQAHRFVQEVLARRDDTAVATAVVERIRRYVHDQKSVLPAWL